MAPPCYTAKFDSFLSLDCAFHPGAIQGREGIKFCHLATLQVTTTSAEIDVEDVNDNYPSFDTQDSEYLRVVQEGDTSFRPLLVIQVGIHRLFIKRAMSLKTCGD